MTKANSEQLLAIEHSGGVLLRAGAGSGKTFVLVEHILYLTRQWIAEYKAGPITFEDYIRTKFSQVVMMTFTKKAAGEMSIRLSERFKNVHEEAQDKKTWQIISDSLSLLTVTTIDGFCRRLITSGYFPHLSTEAEIIFGSERLDQIKILFERWLKGHEDLPLDILDIIVKEKKHLLNSFTQIFSDPGLRLAWKNYQPKQGHPSNLGPILSESFDLNNLSSSLLRVHQLDLPAESERSAFEKIVAGFQETGLPEIRSTDSLIIYDSLFAAIKVLRGESGKKKTPQHEEAKNALVEVRDWVRKWRPVMLDYEEHYEDKIKPWLEVCVSLFQFIDEHLDPNQGMTFGDIEYHVFQGLQDREAIERIKKTYQYFIVDEFQDTSYLQFMIIRSLLDNDFNKLFCVGDAKQAIYGFRGGELSVFHDCGELVPQVRSLAHNYRSLPRIIKFNNSLFKSVLPAGESFEGLDPFSVISEDQTIPLEDDSEEIATEMVKIKLERNVEGLGKFSSDEINQMEARGILQGIKEHRSRFSGEVCTILYKKLKPSTDLIRLLIKDNLGFTAQFKIDLDDDPVMGIFLVLLKRQFDSGLKTKVDYPIFLMENFLKILHIPKLVDVTLLESFDQDVKFWGLLEAFKKFLFRLQITNENADINLEVIESLCHLFHQDPEEIMLQLMSGDSQRVSLEFRYGENSHLVQIMTAHASKGLEFDAVFLGGIYTNGRENADREMFGNKPGSFYWYMDLVTKDKQKSPQYLLEAEYSLYKGFSESKRLFYVACTRAKKKIYWVEMDGVEFQFSIPKNSWIDAIHYWKNHTIDMDVMKDLDTIESDFTSNDVKKRGEEHPLFFYDSVGVHAKAGSVSELSILSELSVTRLNSLVDCPRKFYFENILKIAPSGEVVLVREWSDESGGEVKASSAERGTFIHEQLAHAITHNFVIKREFFESKISPQLNWTLKELQGMNPQFSFIAEKPIKFKLFNFMISGIPDLVAMPKMPDQKIQIWDFKTGRITQEKLHHYWLQLKAYAYALYQLGECSLESEIELKLCFVDEEKILIESTTFSQSSDDLFELWSFQNKPWSIKTDHCSQCIYGDICPR